MRSKLCLWLKRQNNLPMMSRFLRRGFTLVEMMVAIAILAISAMIIYSSNSNAIRHQLKLEEITIGHWLLLNAIEEEKFFRIVEPDGDPVEERRLEIGNSTYLVVREPLDTDSDTVEMIEFSVEVVDPDIGNYLIDRMTTVMRRSE